MLWKTKDGSQPVANGYRSLRGNPARQHPLLGFPARQHAPALHRHGSTPIHDHLLAYDMGRAVENAIWITNGLNKMGRHISWHIVVYERSIFRGCNFEAADDGQWLIFYLDQVKRILSNVAAISYHHCHRFTDIMHSIASKRQLCARLREGSMRHKQRGWL